MVPIPQEIYLSSTPLVSGVVVFGRGKPQVGMLIEPKADYAVDPKDEDAVIEFRRKLWQALLVDVRSDTKYIF